MLRQRRWVELAVPVRRNIRSPMTTMMRSKARLMLRKGMRCIALRTVKRLLLAEQRKPEIVCSMSVCQA
jgi:translation initiation factor 2 beta subunit (eIF-2beta)/eIF-5